MDEALRDVFAWFYRGRHAPADALWWLDNPALPSPAGTPPVQTGLLDAADQLDLDGFDRAAAALREAIAEVLAADRRTASLALIRANSFLAAPSSDPPKPARTEGGVD